MRVLWAALVIGTVSACALGIDDERAGASSSMGPDRGGDASSPAAGRVPRTPAARDPKPLAELAFSARSDSESDAGAEGDAGADGARSELERAFVYDCTETLRCMGRPANNIPACVRSVREALNAASPQTRQVFLESVRRCRPQHDCDYVDCVSRR